MKKITEKIKKFTIITLVIATIISCIPLVNAESANKNMIDTSNGELVDKREMYSKQFSNNDGTITAVSYVNPVHYQDDKGNWKDIDNSLVDANKGVKKVAGKNSVATDEFLSNKDNPYANFNFNKKTSDTNLIHLNVDDYEIAWGLSNLNSVSATVLNNDSKQDRFNLKSLQSGVVYKNALNNADLYYYISSNNLKEEIILNKKTDIKELVYNVKTTLKPVATDTSMVVFLNEKEEVVFTFQAPYMYDSAEKSRMTYETSVKVEKTNDGYKLVYTLDTKWLESEERVYPIVIDPTVTNGRSQQSVLDTYISKGDKVSDYHVNADRLYVGKYNTTSRAMFNWSALPTIGKKDVINSAYITFNLFKGTSTWGKMSLYRVSGSWDSSKITWATRNDGITYKKLKENLEPNLTPSNNNGYYGYKVTVTDTVKGWYDGTVSKDGFLVRYTDEAYNDYNALVSSDSGVNDGFWPSVWIKYTPDTPETNPYEDLNWKYPLNTAYTGITQDYHATKHPAIDIGTKSGQTNINGQTIYAPQDGTVLWAGWSDEGGNVVFVKSKDKDPKTGNTIVYGFSHMQNALKRVQELPSKKVMLSVM